MSDNQNKQQFEFISKNYLEGRFTLKKTQEEINKIANENSLTIEGWLEKVKNKKAEDITTSIKESKKPYSCDNYELKGKNGIKKELEIAESGLTVMLANTSHFKTFCAINLFCDLIKNNEKACYISVEESEEDITTKILTCYFNKLTKNKARKIDRSSLKKNIENHRTDLKSLRQNGLILCESDFSKENPDKTFNDVVLGEICKNISDEYKYIFIDYIQDIELENQRNKGFNYQLKDLIRTLNSIATQKDVSFIINAQTSKDVKAPFFNLDSVGDSYDIVRKAKTVYGLWNTQKRCLGGDNKPKEEKRLHSYQDKNEPKERPFILIECLKSRSGLAGYANAFHVEPDKFLINSQDTLKGQEEYIIKSNISSSVKVVKNKNNSSVNKKTTNPIL